VIKIKCSDLPGGLHVRVDVQGRNTILYLLPGLTPAQRKAAIRRARSAARVGHGPGLPALGVARALAADRIRTTVRNGFAAMRMHPVIFFPPMVIVVGGAVAYLLLVSVSVRFYPPHTAEPRIVVGISKGGSPLRHGGAKDGADPPAGGTAPGSPGSSAGLPPGGSPGSSRSPGQPPWPGPSRSRHPSSPGPSPLPSSPQPSAPAPAPSPAPSALPSPGSGSGGGVCVQVGPFGMCVGL
jgi:hypothetical protein